MSIHIVSHKRIEAQYPLYRTRAFDEAYPARMGKKPNKTKGTPAWAVALDDYVRESKKTTWAKIAAKLDMTEGGIRHWRNGTREIKLSEFIALCSAAGADPSAIMTGERTGVPPTDLSAKEEMMLTLFRGLTPEQQRELTLETLAQVDANRRIREFVMGELRTYSNEDVRQAYGDIPPLQPRQRRRAAKTKGRDIGDAMGDFLDSD